MAGGQYKDGKLEMKKYLNLSFIPEHAHAQSFEISWLKLSTLKQNFDKKHKNDFQSELETSKIFQNILPLKNINFENVPDINYLFSIWDRT